MPVIFHNDSAAALGLVDVSGAMVSVGAMGGALVFEPDSASREIMDIYAASTQGRIETVTAPENTALPTVSLVPAVGQTASSSVGVWTGAEPIAYARQWERSVDGGPFAPIPGATFAAYTVQEADMGYVLRIQVTATNAGGSATAASLQTAIIAAEV